ncbi:sarcosine oxidase subunit gamma [Alphaproteobacteria bacterium GH1-50]|uniref:Sarcosine oxidase subunit gamma n=1 Tax=Kangsaoukella pontilimi TaxID=2691042 RepID=A0A7C9MBQ9_9RHOB|nr:sarcosine oxidase subunit gamma family protein [Kangsaoukella pontilimi]MXQ06991.1 sarcosine oxidase subunit gamma [Kangsaoukella pontilimi]
MSDRISALPGAASSGSIRVEEAGLQGMVTIRGDLGDKGVSDALKKVVGLTVPEKGQRGAGDGMALLWMSPDELMLTAAHSEAPDLVTKLGDALSGHHHLVCNVSDARAVFRLTGEGAAIRDALAKLTPADLRPSALPVGMVRRTRLAQVAAAVWFEDEGTATVVCFRSVAAYVFGLLANASKPGAEVGYFR